MSAPARDRQDSARCGVFDNMCQALRARIEDGSFANVHRYEPTAALRDAGFSAAEVVEYLDDVCEVVIPRPGDWQSLESVTSRIIRNLESGQ